MPNLQLIKNAFNTGEISPYAMGRTDFQGQSGNKYDHACESIQNFIPLIQGGCTKRPGTLFVAQSPSNNVRLIPFANASAEHSYVIEVTPTLCRFYKNNGIIVTATTTTTTQTNASMTGGIINVVSTAGFTSSGQI